MHWQYVFTQAKLDAHLKRVLCVFTIPWTKSRFQQGSGCKATDISPKFPIRQSAVSGAYLLGDETFVNNVYKTQLIYSL